MGRRPGCCFALCERRGVDNPRCFGGSCPLAPRLVTDRDHRLSLAAQLALVNLTLLERVRSLG